MYVFISFLLFLQSLHFFKARFQRMNCILSWDRTEYCHELTYYKEANVSTAMVFTLQARNIANIEFLLKEPLIFCN